ncbi:helix-turn-helix domain-containing protein [Arthrobacter agilis]|nr:helix-turn-helix transcriptional regulator [Arthrobacter agilis]
MTTNPGFGMTTNIDGNSYRVDITALAIYLVQSVSDFGFYARQRREFLNLSQQAVASFMKDQFAIPWHQTVVAKVESGDRQVKLTEALALAFIYGMTLDDLVMGLDLENRTRLVPLERDDDGVNSEKA